MLGTGSRPSANLKLGARVTETQTDDTQKDYTPDGVPLNLRHIWIDITREIVAYEDSDEDAWDVAARLVRKHFRAMERILSADPNVLEAAWENMPSEYDVLTEDAGAMAKLLRAVATAALGQEASVKPAESGDAG